MPARDTSSDPVLRPTAIPSTNRLLIRQGRLSDLAGVLRVCETHAIYWDGRLPSEAQLAHYFERVLRSQDEVFQLWVAERAHGPVIGWEMLSAFGGDPLSRRLTAEATTCLGQQSAELARTLVTHAIRRAARTPLQYLFARVPTRDTLTMEVLESVGYQEVGLIPPALKPPARPEQVEFVYLVER
jgi:L-amino acid N-acyltransferase YncA